MVPYYWASARRVAGLACMDARLSVDGILGSGGDGHVVRNAGG
jgi:carbonic anhydrase